MGWLCSHYVLTTKSIIPSNTKWGLQTEQMRSYPVSGWEIAMPLLIPPGSKPKGSRPCLIAPKTSHSDLRFRGNTECPWMTTWNPRRFATYNSGPTRLSINSREKSRQASRSLCTVQQECRDLQQLLPCI